MQKSVSLLMKSDLYNKQVRLGDEMKTYGDIDAGKKFEAADICCRYENANCRVGIPNSG